VKDLGSLVLLMIAVGMMVLLLTRTRSQQREAAAVQSRIVPGVEVMTGGGLFATVIEVDDDVVTLETSPGQRSRWDRRAVVRIVTDESSGSGDDPVGEGADPEVATLNEEPPTAT
jgi:preprotein translocase subunit YajC